ncbi:hypothetical protein A2526_01265 [candidate division WOR-1 bacterium RIFOXYD2_FULL_36_8]|nr:MAG: hypothetical protein A2282_02395 [candidate division WOR-1 bacterium RIFOXYA12_FULL_36_13]OGC38917.1 MAG: hypothetical protein A2526_01265 [candidate division WOR-1 bacterium RIFOXYD2_FULL_36_8]
MQRKSVAILLRIFIGESDHFQGKPLYQYLIEYLKKNHYAGVTVLRGIAGFGHASRIHTMDILALSSDLPIVIEVVDTEEKIEALKNILEKENIIESGLVTEEKVNIIQYGRGS